MSANDDGEDGNVVPFAPPSTSLRVDRSSRAVSKCDHGNVEISERRELSCKDCGRDDLDPYAYILYLARHWEELFAKNSAAGRLEGAIRSILAAHGSITVNDDGVTARRLTASGAKLETRESWGTHWHNGGPAAAIAVAVARLESDAARWGAGKIVYPRWTVAKVRGRKRWEIGLMDGRGWERIGDAPTPEAAYRIARDSAAKLDKPLIFEDRPRRLWR